MVATFDPKRQLAAIGDDVRRSRDTVEKLNHPNNPRLFQAVQLLTEAAALLGETAGNGANAARVERF